MSILKYVCAYLTTEFNIMVFLVWRCGVITYPSKYYEDRRTLFNFIMYSLCIIFLANQDLMNYLVRVGKMIQQSLHIK